MSESNYSNFNKVNADVFSEKFEMKFFGLSKMQFIHTIIGIAIAVPTVLAAYFGFGLDLTASLLCGSILASPVLVNAFITNDDKLTLFEIMKWRYKNNQRGALVYQSTQTVNNIHKVVAQRRAEEDKLLGIEPEKKKSTFSLFSKKK